MLEGESISHTHDFTYRRCDAPAPHACHLEASLLHLFIRQFDMEVELIVASADDNLAALLWEISDAWIKLDIAIIFECLT